MKVHEMARKMAAEWEVLTVFEWVGEMVVPKELHWACCWVSGWANASAAGWVFPMVACLVAAKAQQKVALLAAVKAAELARMMAIKSELR